MAAGSTISQRLAIEGVAEILRRLDEMGSAGEQMARRIRAAAASGPLDRFEAATVRGARAIDQFHSASKDLEGGLARGISSVNRFTHGFGELRGVIGALAPMMKDFAEIGIGAGFLLSVRSAANATRELVNRAAELGTTTEKLEGMGYAAAGVGLSVEDTNRAFARLAARIGETQRNATQTSDTLALHAREYSLQQDKQTQSLTKYDEELAKLRREQALSGQAAEHLATGIDRTNLALDKQTASTYAAKNAADKLAASGGSLTAVERLKVHDTALKSHIGVENQVEAQEHRVNATREAAISVGERIRDVENKIKNTREEGAIATEKARLAVEKGKDEIVRLGVAVFDSGGKGRDFIDIVGDIADKLKGMATQQERAAVMLKIFGRGWAEVDPLIKLGSRGIFEATEAFRKMALTESEIAKGLEFSGAWNKMLYALAAVKNSVGDILSTVFTPWFDAVREFFMTNIEEIREWGQALANVAGFITGQFLAAFKDVFGQIAHLFGIVKGWFDDIAKLINHFFHTNVTGADLMVGLVAFHLTVKALMLTMGLFWTQTLGIRTALMALGPVFTSVAAGARALMMAFSAGELLPLLAILGPAGWIVAGLLAVGAIVLTLKGKWGAFFDWWAEGFTRIIQLLKDIYKIMQYVGMVPGNSAPEVGAPGSTSESGAYMPTADQQADYGARANQEAAAHHSGGGWISGSGRGDKVPIVAEPGEFMVKRSIASRFGSFLSALNAGLVGRFSMGGIVDSLNNPAPATARTGLPAAGAAGNDQALFHLTIGDKTFNNLSAPKDTADEMLRFARTSSMVSMGKRQSFVGG